MRMTKKLALLSINYKFKSMNKAGGSGGIAEFKNATGSPSRLPVGFRPCLRSERDLVLVITMFVTPIPISVLILAVQL